jgi:uncharacterized protein YdaU (DUF1376 family)
MTKVLFVEWCADDVLGGTANMDPVTELAYRRIIDLIYSTEDRLLDNDSLQYATKAGQRWKKIRRDLIEVHKKITIENGFIRQEKCTEKIEKSRKNIEQKAEAGKASAEARKSLKDNNAGSTAVGTDVGTADITGVPTNQEPNNQGRKEDKPLTPFTPPPPVDDLDPDGPVSFTRGAKRSTPWFTGKVITWTAGEYDDAMRDHEVTQAQIDRYLKDRDKFYTQQPDRVQANWRIATIRDFSQQFGNRKR